MSRLKPISNPPSSKPSPKESPSTDPLLEGRLRIAPLRSTSTIPPGSRKRSPRLRTSPARADRLVVVDVENKPGTYGPGDFTHAKLTAIGWMPVGAERKKMRSPVEGRVLRRWDPESMVDVAAEFREVWNEADRIVGHNFRRHDVGILNGWLYGLGLPLLSSKPIIDTYLDQPKLRGISRSLENLGERWECPVKKPHLPEHVWEAAYDGVPWGVERMLHRVMADCVVNEWLYHELARKGLLTIRA